MATQQITPIFLYALVYEPGPAYDPTKPAAQQLGQHAAYIAELRSQGILVQGHPFDPDLPSYPVLQVSESRAQTVLASDPTIAAGILIGTVYRWHPKYGIYPPM